MFFFFPFFFRFFIFIVLFFFFFFSFCFFFYYFFVCFFVDFGFVFFFIVFCFVPFFFYSLLFFFIRCLFLSSLLDKIYGESEIRACQIYRIVSPGNPWGVKQHYLNIGAMGNH